MNVRTVRNTEPRIEYPNISNLGILAYGYNNLYPQDIRAIVACSETGTSCLNRYVQFIQGNGFKDVAFSETLINRQGETADDLLLHLATDLASFGGFSVHVNYNLLGEIAEINHVPFENCRLGEEDDFGYIGKIAVFPDWSGKKRRNSRILRPNSSNIDFLDIFNPDKETVFTQIEAAGGIENYKGQILWVSAAGRLQYPKSLYDCIVTQMSTEEGLGNISYRNTRNNFLPSGYFVTKKGQDTPQENGDDDNCDARYAHNYGTEDDSIKKALEQIQGDVKAGVILNVEIEHDEEMPKFEPFEGRNYDKDFTVTSDTACEKIYAAFGQEAWHRIRKGSLGFSADILRDTYENYSTTTGPERRMIERAFDKLFRYWYEPVTTKDFTVQPLKYISSETSDNI